MITIIVSQAKFQGLFKKLSHLILTNTLSEAASDRESQF